MKNTLKAAMLCMVISFCTSGYAQSLITPHPPGGGIVNAPGATLSQIVDTMLAYADSSDTAEGGIFDQITVFLPAWEEARDAGSRRSPGFSRAYWLQQLKSGT